MQDLCSPSLAESERPSLLQPQNREQLGEKLEWSEQSPHSRSIRRSLNQARLNRQFLTKPPRSSLQTLTIKSQAPIAPVAKPRTTIDDD